MDVREKLVELIFDSLCRHIDKSCKLAENIADDILGSDLTVQEWIPVDDRLPEEECRCLVIDAAGDIEIDCYDGKGRFVLDRIGAEQHPSHWVPFPNMPHPPKGE